MFDWVLNTPLQVALNTSFARSENATFLRCLEDVSRRHPLCLSKNFVAYRGAQFQLTNILLLTHLLPMHLFSTLRKHQKALRFSDVSRGQRKGILGTNGLIQVVFLYDEGQDYQNIKLRWVQLLNIRSCETCNSTKNLGELMV